jgi:nucleoside-diphosphate-sugar epimerase
MNSLSNIIVTGGAGFIGSALVKQLCREGHHIRAIDNLLRGSLQLPKTFTNARWFRTIKR